MCVALRNFGVALKKLAPHLFVNPLHTPVYMHGFEKSIYIMLVHLYVQNVIFVYLLNVSTYVRVCCEKDM